MANVSIRQLVKRFDQHEILSNIDLDIADGEFIALVGESGCGKSTLLRLLAGLETCSSGEIHIGNRPVNHLAPGERDVAMVFQSYALYPHLSVAANLGFPLRLRKEPSDRLSEKVGRIAHMLGLEALLDRRPRALSGGQRQRVAMGRAMIRQPQVFLFDEPLSNLDAKMRIQMRAELKTLHRQLGTTAVYVTHDQVEAMTLADRIVVMDKGCIQQVGTPLQVYDHPANRFVAGFIGSPAMNFARGTLDGTTLRLPGAALEAVSLTGHAEIDIGVRPEHLQMVAPTEGHAARVVLIEPLGHTSLVHVDVFGTRWVALENQRRPLQSGDTIGLRWRPELQHTFDVSTGQRLPDHAMTRQSGV